MQRVHFRNRRGFSRVDLAHGLEVYAYMGAAVVAGAEVRGDLARAARAYADAGMSLELMMTAALGDLDHRMSVVATLRQLAYTHPLLSVEAQTQRWVNVFLQCRVAFRYVPAVRASWRMRTALARVVLQPQAPAYPPRVMGLVTGDGGAVYPAGRPEQHVYEDHYEKFYPTMIAFLVRCQERSVVRAVEVSAGPLKELPPSIEADDTEDEATVKLDEAFSILAFPRPPLTPWGRATNLAVCPEPQPPCMRPRAPGALLPPGGRFERGMHTKLRRRMRMMG